MSWSIHIIGKASKVFEALNAKSNELIGNEKQEFDAVLPMLRSIVLLNFNSKAHKEPVLDVEASGHTWCSTDQQDSSSFYNVKVVQVVGAQLAE